MIKGLFETHLFVSDLERSVNFYGDVLGLEQCYYEEARRAAFFWIGAPQSAMLGLWEHPADEIDIRHFAFRVNKDDLLYRAGDFLKERGIEAYNFLKDGSGQPMVFAWMPAIAIYFNDPDGHILEFISILEGTPLPEAGVVSYQKWLQLNNTLL